MATDRLTPELHERLIRVPARRRAHIIRDQAIALVGALETNAPVIEPDLVRAHADAVIAAWSRLLTDDAA